MAASKLEQSLSRLRSNDPTLTILDLSKQDIGTSGASALATALQRNSILTQLNLSSNRIGNSAVNKLAAALQHNSSLTTLDLFGNEIGASGASGLATALQHNSSLTTLDLSGNEIGDLGACGLAAALQHNSSLTSLDLADNKIGDFGASAFMTTLKYNSTLISLHLSDNSISNALRSQISALRRWRRSQLAETKKAEEEAALQLAQRSKEDADRKEAERQRHIAQRDREIVDILNSMTISAPIQDKLFDEEGLDRQFLSFLSLEMLGRSGVFPEIKARALLQRLQSLTSPSYSSSTSSSLSSATTIASSSSSPTSQTVIIIRHSELTYDPHRPLAKGSFGCVYDATFKGQRVAVKTLFSPEGQAEFLRESEVMSSLRAPYLVCLIGITLEPQTMVMELMEGGSLFDLLHRKKTVPLSWAMQWKMLHQIAQGIQSLHSQSVAHRDLKSGNILLSEDFQQIKLADFGLSRRCDDDGMAGTLTSLAGTLPYMAPELLSSTASQSSLSADIYAFAIIMWEVGFRTIPWQSTKDIEMLKRQVRDAQMRPVIDESVGLSTDFIQLMLQCWAHESHQRPVIDSVILSLDLCRTIAPGMNPYHSVFSSSNNDDIGSIIGVEPSLGNHVPPPKAMVGGVAMPLSYIPEVDVETSIAQSSTGSTNTLPPNAGQVEGDWTVQKWLHSIQLADLIPIFEEQDLLEPSDIKELTDLSLREIGIAKLGQRTRILRYIKQLN